MKKKSVKLSREAKFCVRYKCVPAKVGQSPGCPPGQVKRCAEFRY